jgi:hypothetical protein
MADINFSEYYSRLPYIDPFIAHGISMSRIARLTALNAYVEAKSDQYKKMLISKELKKPFLQKLFELKGAV